MLPGLIKCLQCDSNESAVMRGDYSSWSIQAATGCRPYPLAFLVGFSSTLSSSTLYDVKHVDLSAITQYNGEQNIKGPWGWDTCLCGIPQHLVPRLLQGMVTPHVSCVDCRKVSLAECILS